MRKKIKEIEKDYKFITKIINSADSPLIKKLILDNIIILTTRHDFLPSNLFYNYLKRGVIDYKDKNVIKYEQNQSSLNKKSAKIIRLFQFGIELILESLKPKKIWNMANTIKKNIILIYVPFYPRYLDLALPIYEKIKNSSDFTPILLNCELKEHFYKNNFTQIKMRDYSVGLNQLCKILKEIIMTKKAIDKEKKYKDFYKALFKINRRTQLINLINENIFRNLIKNTKKIKAIFFSPPNSLARTASEIAKESNIPTFGIFRGLIDYDLESKFINTKYILAKGEREKEMYIKLGYEEKKIEVVGAPYLKEKILNRYTVDGQIKIFYVDQPCTQNCDIQCKRKIIRLIGNKLRCLNNIKLLIKLHPVSTDHEKIYEEEFYTIGFSNYQIYKSKYDLSKVLDISDYVIMHHSTVGLNVLFRNKPLIVLSSSFFGIDINIDGENLFFNEKSAFIIKDEQDLQDIFTCISEGKLKRKKYKDVKTFLKYHIKYTGETSAEHIVKFIENKIEESELGGKK